MNGKKVKQIRKLIAKVTGLDIKDPRVKRLYKGAKKKV